MTGFERIRICPVCSSSHLPERQRRLCERCDRKARSANADKVFRHRVGERAAGSAFSAVFGRLIEDVDYLTMIDTSDLADPNAPSCRGRDLRRSGRHLAREDTNYEAWAPAPLAVHLPVGR